MNLADPELELIDPTPNIHTLFLHFDKLFFWAKLTRRAVVRWSKRMYSCAGICSYEGSGGLCDIALSEPLLKLRPRKDLVETLLHEMIHAYLFITCRDRERDGHGPNFQAHMHRINRSAGVNITIYHDFHDEVELYLNHWWRCNGPCQKSKPYFGVVRRSQNRAPGPADFWWNKHQKHCGGTFVKIKEPEKKNKKQVISKPKENITKYMNNNNNNTVDKNIKTISDLTNCKKPLTPILKNSTNIPASSIRSNGGKIVVSPNTQKLVTFDSKNNKPDTNHVFTGVSKTLDINRKRSNSVDAVVETVREVWLKKYGNLNSKPTELTRKNSMIVTNKEHKANKHKADTVHAGSPLKKVRKIDDYFKNAATSVLKDIYGADFKITQKDSDKKIIAVPVKVEKDESKTFIPAPVSAKVDLVDCPVCNLKINSKDINKHLDECLNKGVIDKMQQENFNGDNKTDVHTKPQFKVMKDMKTVDLIGPPFKPKMENSRDKLCVPKQEGNNVLSSSNVSIDLTNVAFGNISKIKKEPTVIEEVNLTFDPDDVAKVKSIVKKIQFDKHIRKSGDFLNPEEVSVTSNPGLLPTFIGDGATENKLPPSRIEPGTSKDVLTVKCPCCGNEVNKPMAEHLDECLSFFDNNTTIPQEGTSISFANNTIDIDDDDNDDDDIFDETQTMNPTGTKTPCPCCLAMVEFEEMNSHLDICLG